MQRPVPPLSLPLYWGPVRLATRISAAWLAAACAASAFLAPSAAAIDREPWSVFGKRRQALAAQVETGVVVLFGLEAHESRPSRAPFRQASSFYYLTGCNEPGAALLIEPGGADQPYRETLFLPLRDESDRLWHGVGISPGDEDLYEQTGFARVLPRDALASELAKTDAPVHGLFIEPHHPSSISGHADGRLLLEQTGYDGATVDLAESVASLRMVKSEGELRLLERAIRATEAAHLAAWRTLRTGVSEAQLLGPMLAEFLEHGALYPAYSPIIGAGANSTALHYSRLGSTADSGDVVLFDVGAEYGGYAADLTRTVPVSGRFSERQRQVYDWVLGAQQEVIAAVKPGMRLTGKGRNSLHRRAVRYFEKQQEGLSDAFPHGLGHHVGLDVHDADTGGELQAGMVVTIEPGLYFPDERLGVRIEDMVLVTPDGARVLSDGLPKDPDEIERLLAQFRGAR